jgi:hypothetical protein
MKNKNTKTVFDNVDFAFSLYNIEMIANKIDLINNKTHLDKHVNTYHVNSLNFRDIKEWVHEKPSDVVALGCSNTYGIGVPQEYTWPSIVESTTGMSVSNLGICGASAEKLLEAFLVYLDRVGNPKYVFACFPDYLRYSQIIEGKFYSFPWPKHNNKSEKIITHLKTANHITGDMSINNSIIKFPELAQYIIPFQESLNQFISSIYVIEKICKLLDIKFYWGSWSEFTQNIFKQNFFLEESFCLSRKNYVEGIRSDALETLSLNDSENFTCSSEHSLNKKYKDSMWDVASDNNHFGIHWQYHTAESFIKNI